MMNNNKIIDYYLLRDENQHIADRVRELIKEGWQPLGGIFENSYNDYIQVMVKYEE